VVTRDFAQWKDEIAWMSLYFTAAVWASLALCLVYSLGDYLPQYRTESAAASWSELRTERNGTTEAHEPNPVHQSLQASAMVRTMLQ
jgi:hypothetical protein